MPIVPLLLDSKNLGKAAQEAFERDVAARFGLVPNFFRSAPDAPFVIHELWLFAKAAYLDARSHHFLRNDFLSISHASAKCAIA
jgi:hypothetical protein